MPKKKTKTSRKARLKARKSQGKLRQLKECYLTAIDYLSKKTPKWLQNFLALWLPISLFTCLQPLTDWIRDKNLVTFSDLILPIVLSFITSMILALIFYWFFTRSRFLALVGAVAAYYAITLRFDMKLQPLWNFFRSFGPVSKIIDFLGGANLVIFAALCVILLYYLFCSIDRLVKSKKWNLDIFYRGVVIAISVAFLIQFVGVLRIAIIEWPQFFYRPAELSGKDVNTNPEKKPDIYYIVLDRYTNQNVLKDQLGFDNSDFINFLKDNGFSVDPSAYGNYPNTVTSVSSTLKANYHSDLAQRFDSATLQTIEPYFNSVYYSPVIKALKKQGYSYYMLGSYYEVSNQAPLADHYYQSGKQLSVFGHTYPLNEFPVKELSKSIYGSAAKNGLRIGNFPILSIGGLNQRDQSEFDIEKLKEIPEDNTGPKFVFAHILVPHNPYFFNADGSLSDNPWVDNVGKPVADKYVGQVEFINRQMKEIVGKILQKTNNEAVILIQADEGPYPSQEKMPPDGTPPVDPERSGVNETQRSLEDLRMKYGILAAYHVPQSTSENLSSGGDSVNIFRLVLNTYFGYNLPYLPKCHYAVSSYVKQLKYVDITEHLTGSANPQCPPDGIFSAQ